MKMILSGICVAFLLITISYYFEIKQERPIEVSYKELIPEVRTQVDCLTQNIYYEAATEPAEGKFAVAMVTMNRVNSNQFKNNVCSVVKQKIDNVCQFSWFCEKKKDINRTLYKQAQNIAVLTYLNYEKLQDVTKGATYYHADYVNPKWKGLQKTVKIGRHIFYKPTKDSNYDEQAKFSFKQKFQSRSKLFFAVDGRDITPVL